jgi:hypothetical protein
MGRPRIKRKKSDPIEERQDGVTLADEEGVKQILREDDFK